MLAEGQGDDFPVLHSVNIQYSKWRHTYSTHYSAHELAVAIALEIGLMNNSVTSTQSCLDDSAQELILQQVATL